MIKTILFEDTEIDKRGILSLLSQLPEIKYIDTYNSMNIALREAETIKPDLIIVDSEIHGDKDIGQKFVINVRKILPNVKILGLTRYAECLEPLKKAGCDGVALKSFIYDEKVAAKYIMETILSKENNLLNFAPPVLDSLEDKILRLIASGKSEEEIGNRIHLNRYSVRKIKSNLKDKFGANKDTELISNAYRYGYLKPFEEL